MVKQHEWLEAVQGWAADQRESPWALRQVGATEIRMPVKVRDWGLRPSPVAGGRGYGPTAWTLEVAVGDSSAFLAFSDDGEDAARGHGVDACQKALADVTDGELARIAEELAPPA